MSYEPAGDEDESVPESSVAFEVAAAVAAEMTSLAVPEPARHFVAASLLPIYLEASRSVVRKWNDVRALNAAQTLHVAADDLGMTVEDFCRKVQSDEKLTSLMGQAMTAASATVLQQKINTLGKVVASGVRDDAKVDESAMLIAALDDLEVPHVAVLTYMGKKTISGKMVTVPSEDFPFMRPPFHGVEVMKQNMPELGVALGPVIATLARHGLIDQDQLNVSEIFRKYDTQLAQGEKLGRRPNMNTGTAVQLGWRMTDFGIVLRDYLAERGAGNPPPAEEEGC